MKSKNLGFTFGGCLLVVVILGLIAGVILFTPSKNPEEANKIKLIKSTMEQLDTAVKKVVAEYGSKGDAFNSCGSGSFEEGVLCFGDILAKNLDINKNCSNKEKSCFSKEPLKNIYGETIKDRDKASNPCIYTFILSNGVSVCIRDYSRFDIDIDGPQNGPNVRGEDNFDFVVSDNSVNYFDVDTNRYNMNEYESLSTTKNARRDIDRAFNANYDSVAWAVLKGNMNYLKCADKLMWKSKVTCK